MPEPTVKRPREPFELKQHAIKMGFKPCAIVERHYGLVPVQITSWPFVEDGREFIMGRLKIGDATSNHQILYETLRVRTGEQDL